MTVPFSARSTADDVLRGLDLRGRVVLVTGATTGIGFETARALAQAQARVYVGARSASSADDTIARLRALLPAPADLVPFVVDLGSLADCAAAASQLTEPALHALIANAGVYGGPYTLTADGLERTVGVCHVGHAQLVRSLLPKLLAAAPSRLVMVASESHRSDRAFDPDQLSLSAAAYSELAAYNRAKLCNVLYANAFDRRFRDQGVRANSLHPGSLVATDISRNSWLAKTAMLFARPFAKSMASAAATSVWAAVHPEAADLGGEYLRDAQVGKASRTGRDAGLADALWARTEALLDQHHPPST